MTVSTPVFDRLQFGGDYNPEIVEAGDVELLVSTSADNLPLRMVVRLTGAPRVVDSGRQLAAPVEIIPLAMGER